METRKFLGQIQSNVDEGLRRGVNSTPTFFVGNRKIATTVSYDEFRQHVNAAMAQAGATKTKAVNPQVPPAQEGTKRP
jgi:hypothetical protein